MKKNILLHSACILTIIFSVISVYYFNQPKRPLENNVCKSTIHYRLNDSTNNFEYNIFISFNFTNSGIAYEHMRGLVIKDEKKHTIARNIKFTYQVRNNNNYEITVSDVNKLGPDNIPAHLISKYFSYTLLNSLTLLKINEISKHLVLVSGLQGPIFICSIS